MLRLLILCVLGLLIGCDTSVEVSCIGSGKEPFEVEVGKTYCISDTHKLVVKAFDDNYCSCVADCSWGGEALIEVVISDGAQDVHLILHEERKNPNAFDLSVDHVITDQGCDPQITQVFLITRG